MNKIIHYILAMTTLFFIVSCDPQELDEILPPPEVPPTPSVVVFYSSRSPEIRARLTISRTSFYIDTTVEYVGASKEVLDPDLEVRLLIDDVDLGPFIPLGEERHRVFTHRLTLADAIQPGTQVDLIGSHPEFGEITSQQTMPNTIPPASIQYIDEVGVSAFPGSYYGAPLHALSISILDHPEPNYYQIGLFQDTFNLDEATGDTINALYTRWNLLEINNPFFRTISNETYFFSDEGFPGDSINFVLFAAGDINENTRLVLRSLTKEYYDYSVSLVVQRSFHQENIGQDLIGGYTTPIDVQGNIEGGVGIFCMAAEKWIPVDF